MKFLLADIAHPYSPFVFTLIGTVIGILLTSSLNHFLNIRAKKAEALIKIKNNTHADFIRAVSRVTMAQKFRDRDAEKSSMFLLLDAKVRLGVYGDQNIVQSAGEFFEKYGTIKDEQSEKAFIEIMHKIRASVVGAENDHDLIALTQLLLK